MDATDANLSLGLTVKGFNRTYCGLVYKRNNATQEEGR